MKSPSFYFRLQLAARLLSQWQRRVGPPLVRLVEFRSDWRDSRANSSCTFDWPRHRSRMLSVMSYRSDGLVSDEPL